MRKHRLPATYQHISISGWRDDMHMAAAGRGVKGRKRLKNFAAMVKS